MLNGQNSQEAKTLVQQGAAVLDALPSGKQSLYALKLRMYMETDYDERKRLAEKQLAIAVEGQLLGAIPLCLIELGNGAFDHGDWAEAKAWALKALAACGETRTHINKAQALLILSRVATVHQEYAEAEQWAQQALTSGEEVGVPGQKWWSHSALADIASLHGDYLTAQHHYQEGLAICQALDDRRGLVSELSGLGSTASGLRQDETARAYLYDALKIAEELNDDSATLQVFTEIAQRLANNGEQGRAVQLHTFVHNHPATSSLVKVWAAVMLERLERDLTPDVYTTAVEQGKTLDLKATAKALLVELSDPILRFDPSSVPLQLHLDILTERELQVLQLIATGLSNYDIALRLFVGVSTVKKHVNHIFDKLDVESRTQAMIRARELNLL